MKAPKFSILIAAAFCAAFSGRMSAQPSLRGVYVASVSNDFSVVFGVDDNIHVNVWIFDGSVNHAVGSTSTTIGPGGFVSVSNELGYDITGNFTETGSSAVFAGQMSAGGTTATGVQLRASRTSFFGVNNNAGSIFNGRFDGLAVNEASPGKTNITFIVDANSNLYVIQETSPGVFTGGIGNIRVDLPTPTGSTTNPAIFAFTGVTGQAVTGSFTTTGFLMTGTFITPTATYDFNAFRTSAANQFANLSTRGFVGTGQNVMIGGFVISGGPKLVLVRVLGPGLANDGVTQPVETPTVTLYSGSTAIATNTGWQNQPSDSTLVQQIRATQLAPPSNGDDAILVELEAGTYTAVVTGANGATGTALVEAYEVLLD